MSQSSVHRLQVALMMRHVPFVRFQTCGFVRVASGEGTNNPLWRPSPRAGLTIVPVVPWEGPPPEGGPDQLPIFYHAVLTFERSM